MEKKKKARKTIQRRKKKRPGEEGKKEDVKLRNLLIHSSAKAKGTTSVLLKAHIRGSFDL